MTTTLQSEIDKQNNNLNALVNQISQGKDAQSQIPQVQGYIDALNTAVAKSGAGNSAQASVSATQTSAQQFQSSTLYTGANTSLTTMLSKAGVTDSDLQSVVAQKLAPPLDTNKSYSDYSSAFTAASADVDTQTTVVANAQNNLALKSSVLDLAATVPAAIATQAQAWFSEAQTDVHGSAAIAAASDLGRKWWLMQKANALLGEFGANFATDIQAPLTTANNALTQASEDYAGAMDTLATAQSELKSKLTTLNQATQDLQTAEAQVLANLAARVAQRNP